MLEQLEHVKNRYDELNRLLQDPASLGLEGYRDAMREYKELTPLVECYDRYAKACGHCRQAQEILEDPATDDELRVLAKKEYEENCARQQADEQQLKLLLLPHDADDARSAIVEIRGGTGGEEAALFGYDMYRMYTMYAQRCGWRTELLSLNETELGGYKEVSFSVEGDGVFSRLKYESGVHRVQRIPATESQGRIQTSAVTVAIMPEAQEVDVRIDPADLKIDAFRASGAGGQHINKTSSAIRITHLPTGMVVECQDERSQLKNKEKAMKVLRSRLYQQEKEKRDAETARQRRQQVGSGDRSERIRTYNFPQGRVTDHRINLTLYRLESVMNGDLDELLQALMLDDQTRRLQQAGKEGC